MFGSDFVFARGALLTIKLMCRLGANYLTLPINQAKNKHHDNHYGGFLLWSFLAVGHMSICSIFGVIWLD